MINYWMLADFLFVALLLLDAVLIVRYVLGFFHSLAMMISYYSLSPELDNNVRCAQQADLLQNFINIRENTVRNIMYSVTAGAGIIFVHYVLEVIHAVV